MLLLQLITNRRDRFCNRCHSQGNYVCQALIYDLPYVTGQAIYIFILSFVVVVLLLFSSPNLSDRRLDVCHTSTHGVALVRI